MIITPHEMNRRRLMARATAEVTRLMDDLTRESVGLTVLEWMRVFQTAQERLVTHGLREEWAAGEYLETVKGG